jgi:O-methyltransferase
MPKLSKIINYPLGLLGLKLTRKPKAEDTFTALQDIEADKDFQKIYDKIKAYTVVEPERCYALYHAVRYIIRNGIQGDFVECGVWKGGSVMLIAYTLLEAGITDRKIYLYDTFEGMTKPGEYDGEKEKANWEKYKVNDQINNWCLSPLIEVQTNMATTGYPKEKVIFIKGKVEQTIPGTLPGKLALLRLDTDWYESTKHELNHLYPLLEKGGILIIDDYGAWPGARKAVDEYFAANGTVYLNRLDFTGRLVIK